MSRRPPTPRQAAARRLAQLGAVCRLQRRDGLLPALAIWGPAVARTLASAPREYRLADHRTLAVAAVWTGLTEAGLRDALHRMGFAPTDVEIAEFLGRTAKNGLPVDARKLGRWIGLTADQRQRARAWSIVAIDQREPVRKEAAEERRRQQNAKASEKSRRKAGARPRPEYRERVRAKTPPGKSRNAVNLAAYRARMKAGPSAKLSTAMKAGPSASLSMKLKPGPSADLSTDESGSVSMPNTKAPNARPIDRFGDAPAARLQRSEPSPCPSLGAGASVVPRTPSRASPEATANGIRNGLSDEWSTPKATAEKRATLRPSPRPPIEDPREHLLLAVFGDRNLAFYIAEELGEGPSDIGLLRAATLGRARLERLRDRIDAVGILSDGADIAIDEARALAFRILATRDVRHVENA